MKFNYLKWLKMRLKWPPWMEKILKFNCLKWLKMHLLSTMIVNIISETKYSCKKITEVVNTCWNWNCIWVFVLIKNKTRTQWLDTWQSLKNIKQSSLKKIEKLLKDFLSLVRSTYYGKTFFKKIFPPSGLPPIFYQLIMDIKDKISQFKGQLQDKMIQFKGQ